jgi:hypothetical protein
MKTIHLELPSDGNEKLSIDISTDFTDDELKLIGQYSELTQRIRDCTLLQRGMSGFQGISFDQAGLSIRAGTCSKPELHELLHVLRPVTLERESASFSRVIEILLRRLANDDTQQFLKLNQHAFQHGEMSLYFQITIGEKPLFHESLLRTWLNGTQYHTDKNKAADWAALEATLGEPSAQAIVMSQLRSKVVAVLNIDYVIKQVILATQQQE